jgi:hypothetical protein
MVRFEHQGTRTVRRRGRAVSRLASFGERGWMHNLIAGNESDRLHRRMPMQARPLSPLPLGGWVVEFQILRYMIYKAG